jgi:NAD(P)-dependent dehydrogenase (short-subunit alcohol dehydrogenase family)
MIVRGPFFLTKLAIPHLQKTKGCIIFTTTSSSSTATPTDPHYMTAKAATTQLFKVLAGWLGPEIRVNCVVPGFVMTDMFRHHPPQMWDHLAGMVPMNCMMEPIDVANAALFLASPEAKHITAVEIPVDGGRCGAMPRRMIIQGLQAMKPGLATYDKEAYGAERISKMDVGLTKK